MIGTRLQASLNLRIQTPMPITADRNQIPTPTLTLTPVGSCKSEGKERPLLLQLDTLHFTDAGSPAEHHLSVVQHILESY